MSGVRPDPGSILEFGRIVVGVDRRQGGRDALALATLLQRRLGGELVAVYVYPFDRTVSLDEADAVEAVLHEDLLAELEQELTRAAVSARPVVVPDAFPARALQAIAERDGADLIVVGAPHRAGAERVLGGDVAAGTLRGAPCAVMVAPTGFAERERMLRTVGVGFDDSAESRAALRLGGRLARAAGAALRVVSVAAAAVPGHEAAAIAEGGTYETVAGQAGRGAGPPQRRSRPPRRGFARPRPRAPAAARQHLDPARPRGTLPGARRPAPGGVDRRRRGGPAQHGGAVSERLTRLLPLLTAAAIALGGAAHLAGAPARATRSGQRRWRSCSCRSRSLSRGRCARATSASTPSRCWRWPAPWRWASCSPARWSP